MDKIYFAIYVDERVLSNVERKFYNELASYRRARVASYRTTKNLDFKKSKWCQQKIEELNYLFSMIHDNSRADKNEFGEYKYPTIYSKRVGDRQYFCLAEEMMDRISIENIFPYIELFKESLEIRNNNVVGAINYLGEVLQKYTSNKNYLNSTYKSLVKDIINKIDMYPLNSICELYLHDNFTLEELKECC